MTSTRLTIAAACLLCVGVSGRAAAEEVHGQMSTGKERRIINELEVYVYVSPGLTPRLKR